MHPLGIGIERHGVELEQHLECLGSSDRNEGSRAGSGKTPLRASSSFSDGPDCVRRAVLDAIHHSIHVRPDIFMDAELPYVPDQDAPGASAYRVKVSDLLASYKVESLPHEKIIANIDQAGKTFHILVLKTNMTIPYTSVFIQLNCKYWSDAAEARLRAKMTAAGSEIK